MKPEFELTTANRPRVARAFRFRARVELAIECAIEGQMGRVFVDDAAHSMAYCLRVGPFRSYAGVY